MTEQVADTEGASATAQTEVASGTPSSTPEIIKLPPGQPPKRRKQKRKDPRQQDRRPAMSFKDLESSDRAAKPRKRPADQGRVREDGTPSRREASRQAMLEWMPNATHPAPLVTVHLRTEYTKRLFLDHFGRAQISLYNLVFLLRIKMREAGIADNKVNDFTDMLEDRMSQQLDDLAERMANDVKKARRMLINNQATEVSRYSGGGDLEATLPALTPNIESLLNLLPVFDEFIGCVDGLWINRFLRTRQREETINSYRNEFAKLIRHYMHMYHESKRLLGEGKHGEMASIFQHGERDELSAEDESLVASIMKVQDVAPSDEAAVAA